LYRFPEGHLSPAKDRDDLLSRFNTYFQAITADTPGLVETALALRYQVYCLERKFEDANQHQDGLERDAHDPHSIHGLVIHRPRHEAIGTARLIFPDVRPNSLPVQQLLRRTGINPSDYFPADSTVEISRFAISKDFRRRSGEGAEGESALTSQAERRTSLPCLGLVQILLRQSIELGITHWSAVMEPQLLRMLAAMGIRFQPIGPLVSHHGLRQPSFCYLPQMLRILCQTKPDHWAVVTDDGELVPRVARPAIRIVA
jgi:N-acyl amino acid synthase of PEP-CTERM/exosortase system